MSATRISNNLETAILIKRLHDAGTNRVPCVVLNVQHATVPHLFNFFNKVKNITCTIDEFHINWEEMGRWAEIIAKPLLRFVSVRTRSFNFSIEPDYADPIMAQLTAYILLNKKSVVEEVCISTFEMEETPNTILFFQALCNSPVPHKLKRIFFDGFNPSELFMYEYLKPVIMNTNIEIVPFEDEMDRDIDEDWEEELPDYPSNNTLLARFKKEKSKREVRELLLVQHRCQILPKDLIEICASYL